MYQHILFPTDGSGISRRAAQQAIALARAVNARITALHVIAPYIEPMPDLMGAYASALTPQDYEKAAKGEATTLLEKVQAQAREAGVECETRIEMDPAPWNAIVRIAQQLGCDAIVMASHGRRGVSGMILGSETAKVLTHCKVPVLVTR
jgi:nucleotide-binding universal stress UspA family protein